MKITEMKLKHYLNEALRNVLEEEKGVEINHDKLEGSESLMQDYSELLTKFEEHIEMVIKINKSKVSVKYDALTQAQSEAVWGDLE